MEELMVVFVVAICTWGFYGLFELFAHRKERLKIIEKLDMERSSTVIDLDIFPKKQNRNMALTLGLLLIGIGLGMFVGYIIYISNLEYLSQFGSRDTFIFSTRGFESTIVGSCVLLFGGVALLAAYLIERRKK